MAKSRSSDEAYILKRTFMKFQNSLVLNDKNLLICLVKNVQKVIKIIGLS